MALSIFSNAVDGIGAALVSEEKQPRALFKMGSMEVLLGITAYFFRSPQGIFLHHAGGYHAALICVTLWGVVSMLAGIWFSFPNHRPGAWCGAAVALLIINVFALLLVLALVFGGHLATTTAK